MKAWFPLLVLSCHAATAAVPEFSLGVSVPQGQTRTSTPANSMPFASVAMAFGGTGDGWLGSSVILRPRLEGAAGGSDYAIGAQRVRTENRYWLGGVDLCLLPAWGPLRRMGTRAYLGLGYARFETTLVGTVPQAEVAGKAVADVGLEFLPIQFPRSGGLGLGARFRHIPQTGEAVAYESVNLYVHVRF